jgi:anti-anti-sigma regulatory factor
MVLRITQNEGSDSGAVLRLEGRVVAEVAAVLEQECSELLRSLDEVSLDLVGVSFVDRAGVEVLQRLSRAGAEILCPSGPVASVLEGAGVRVTLDADSVDDDRL